MKNILLFSICFSFYGFSVAQQFGYQFSDNFAFKAKGVDILHNFDNKLHKSKNSFYLYDEPYPGNIKIYGNDVIISGYSVKYDLHNQLIEFIKDDSIYYIPQNKVFFFKMWVDKDAKLFINASAIKNSEVSFGFYEVLEYGDVCFLKYVKLNMQEPMGHSYGANVQTKKYVKKVQYYFFKEDVIIKFRKKRKEILSLLSNKKTEVSQYVKDKKLSFRKEEDLILIFKHFNNLLCSEKIKDI